MSPARMYDTARWRRLRARVLAEEPLCRMCLRLWRDTAATTVDHITPHAGDPALFWARENLQALCASCHSGTKRVAEHHGHSQAAGTDGLPLDAAHPWCQ